MLIEAIERPIRYQFLDGQQLRLTPGCPVDLPEAQARSLLARVPNRMRVASILSQPDTVIGEPACGRRLVFWEGPSNCILGPGFVTQVAKETTVSGQARFWLCVEFGGSWRWIHESLLRSRAAYDRRRLHGAI